MLEDIALHDLVKRPWPRDISSSGEVLGQFLLKRLTAYPLTDGHRFRLPSIIALSQQFHTGFMDVYDAFQVLRCHGYDYDLTGLDEPVEFWFRLYSAPVSSRVSKGC